jgi:acetoin utilization protein AcuC
MTSAPSDPAAGPPTALVCDDALLAYDFGPYHPMSPVRLRLARLLAETSGVHQREGVRLLSAPSAEEQDLLRVHTPEYLDGVRAASHAQRPDADDAFIHMGIGGEDVPAFPGMHEASARVVGATMTAMDAVVSGRVDHAVNVAGGMHHARAAHASGFCVYNDLAVAILRALDQGEQRILYVDLDVHHGDGVERALWNEPRAVTLSIHETGEQLFPGTGYVQDTGGPGAQGSAINVPLPPRTDANGWLRAIGATVPALARAVRPTLLVTQHGADTHRTDPLGDLRVTLEAQREAMLLMRQVADEVCGGRWLAVGGGGYAVTDVVPRSWTHLEAIASGAPLPADGPVPEAYSQGAAPILAEYGLLGERVPSMGYGDGVPLEVKDWARGFDPEDDLDRAVQAARRAAFPEWGLDPYLD